MAPVRIESVQNATDQAKSLAAWVAGGDPVPYEAVPWFWSDQGPLKLQIAGLGLGIDRTVVRGTPEAGNLSSALRLYVLEELKKQRG